MQDDPVTRAGPGRPARPDAGPVPPGGGAGWFVGPDSDPDRYELVGSGRRGGEGTTWRARYRGDLSAPLEVAVKQLHPPAGAGPDWPTRADVRRWEDQRALLQYLRIEHLVVVHDVFLAAPPHPAGLRGVAERPLPYVVMEWVSGPTLAERVSGHPATAATLPERLRWIEDLAVALHTLHSRARSAGNPTLHRDVKPANCILDPARRLVLVDVSTMRPVADTRDPAGLHSPPYTAPEVLRDPYAERGPASDVYALGALAAFCMTGADPPAGTGAAVRDHVVAAAGAAGVPDPAGYAEHLLAALHPEPGGRPADPARWARELVRRSGRSRRARARPRRRTGPLAAAAAVVALVAAGIAARGLTGPDRTAPVATGPVSAGPVSAAPTSAAPAPAAPVSRQPGPRPVPSAGSRPPPVVAAGRITSPPDRADVHRCEELTGTATVPAGKALVLAMRNLDNGDPTLYLQWTTPVPAAAGRTAWRGTQYFGSTEGSLGQHYRVDLLLVDAGAARRSSAAARDGVWGSPGVPAWARSIAAVTDLRRVPDTGPSCGG